MKSRLLLVMISIMAWLINGIFVYIQIKDFDKNYIEMRKNGGNKSGINIKRRKARDVFRKSNT